jgi:hypothetical protein
LGIVRSSGKRPSAIQTAHRGEGRVLLRIRKAGIGRAQASDIKAGDRLVVLWRASRATGVDGLPAARLVIDRGPAKVAPADASAPEQGSAPQSDQDGGSPAGS